jgi:hypothetical protein
MGIATRCDGTMTMLLSSEQLNCNMDYESYIVLKVGEAKYYPSTELLLYLCAVTVLWKEVTSSTFHTWVILGFAWQSLFC